MPQAVLNISLQQSITLQNIVLSSLTADAIVILQVSIREAVADVTSIRINFISTPILSSSAAQRPPVLQVSTLHEDSALRSRKNVVQTSANEGIVASYSIVGPTSVLITALNPTFGSSNSSSELAALCAARLSAQNGSLLMTSIKTQVGRNSSTLLTLLANTTVAKVTVVVVKSAPPSPMKYPTASPSNVRIDNSSDSSTLGFYIGIAVAVAFIVVAVLTGYWYLRLRKSSTVIATFSTDPSPIKASEEVVVEFDSASGEETVLWAC